MEWLIKPLKTWTFLPVTISLLIIILAWFAISFWLIFILISICILLWAKSFLSIHIFLNHPHSIIGLRYEDEQLFIKTPGIDSDTWLPVEPASGGFVSYWLIIMPLIAEKEVSSSKMGVLSLFSVSGRRSGKYWLFLPAAAMEPGPFRDLIRILK